MYSIGPYTFTETDATRTVTHAFDVWELFEEGRDTAAIDGLRPVLSGDLETDLERVWEAWLAAGPALRGAGQLPSRRVGSVAHLHLSDGGLPKSSVDEVEVTWRGVTGDRQATRVHHGRPWQALCLWSCEVIEAFQADGHPIAHGLAGENITLRGFDWSDIRAGVRLELGEALCEVSAYALPCFQNTDWFLQGDFNVMHHERGPVSRVYATVLRPGRIRVGDAATLEP